MAEYKKTGHAGLDMMHEALVKAGKFQVTAEGRVAPVPVRPAPEEGGDEVLTKPHLQLKLKATKTEKTELEKEVKTAEGVKDSAKRALTEAEKELKLAELDEKRLEAVLKLAQLNEEKAAKASSLDPTDTAKTKAASDAVKATVDAKAELETAQALLKTEKEEFETATNTLAEKVATLAEKTEALNKANAATEKLEQGLKLIQDQETAKKVEEQLTVASQKITETLSVSPLASKLEPMKALVYNDPKNATHADAKMLTTLATLVYEDCQEQVADPNKGSISTLDDCYKNIESMLTDGHSDYILD